jgi:hypothetical protein
MTGQSSLIEHQRLTIIALEASRKADAFPHGTPEREAAEHAASTAWVAAVQAAPKLNPQTDKEP